MCPHCGQTLDGHRDWRSLLVDDWDTLRRPNGTEGLPLSPKEAALLTALVEHAGGYVHRVRLIGSMWGDEGGRAPETYEREVKRYVVSLRAKLEASGWGPARRIIRNVSHRGWGLDTRYLASRRVTEERVATYT